MKFLKSLLFLFESSPCGYEQNVGGKGVFVRDESLAVVDACFMNEYDDTDDHIFSNAHHISPV